MSHTIFRAKVEKFSTQSNGHTSPHTHIAAIYIYICRISAIYTYRLQMYVFHPFQNKLFFLPKNLLCPS